MYQDALNIAAVSWDEDLRDDQLLVTFYLTCGIIIKKTTNQTNKKLLNISHSWVLCSAQLNVAALMDTLVLVINKGFNQSII